MELDQQVIDLFHSSIDTTMRSLDGLTPQISAAGSLLAQCLLAGNKILCAGTGNSSALSQIFVANLVNRFDYERPNLPALNLSTDPATLTAITSDSGFNEIFAHPLRALGQPGDTLVIIAHGEGTGTTVQAIQAAHEKELRVVALCDQTHDDFTALLYPEDVLIAIPGENRARVIEVHLQIINYLSELIDQQLFGSHLSS